MKVDISMTTTKEMFEVQNWWAHSPDFVLASLERQLQAASAVWPELAGYRIEKKHASKARGGTAGGEARAAALTPERRSEIASEAAKARWKPQQADTGSVK